MTDQLPTPIPITLMGTARFVFYFKPQLVADTLNNVPQFYVDVVDKKQPDRMQRLYITCKMQEEVWFLSPEEIKTNAKALSMQLMAYLKKHFGSGVSVLETMIHQTIESVYSVEKILGELLDRHQMIQEEVVKAHYTATRDMSTDGEQLYVRISPALLNWLIVSLWEKKPADLTAPALLSGSADWDGKRYLFEIDDLSNFKLEPDVWRQFISPRLVEDTLNTQLRSIFGLNPDGPGVMITNITFDD